MIEFAGLEIPLLALPDEKHVAVLGNRRAAALKSMSHYDQIPLYVAHNAAELDAWCQADKELTRAGTFGTDVRPWGWSERAAVLDYALNVIGRPGGAGTNRGSVTEVLARYFEVHEIHLRNAMYLLRFARAGGAEAERAAALLALVESGELMPQSAYRKLRDGDPAVMAGGAAAPPEMGAKRQAATLRNTVSVLTGTVMGLRQMGDISPDLPEAVRAEVLPAIQDARRLLARIARQLQGLSEPVDESNKGESA